MSLLPSASGELAAPHRHCCFRGDRPLLSAQDNLVDFWVWDRSEMIFYSSRRPESGHISPTTAQITTDVAGEEQWPGIDSRYRLIVVASLRTKQLLRSSSPRIEADPRKRRNTSIALEEVKRGLVPFTITDQDQKRKGDGTELRQDGLQ